jgi:4-hydroxy-3-methylbut-2-enyl diphosphate reductase
MKAIAPRSDVVLVIGAPNSSNSMRLVEVAKRAGAKDAALIQRAKDIDWAMFAGANTVGLSAGASAPEVLVDEVIDAFRSRYDLKIEEVTVSREDIVFNLPRVLAEPAA